MWRTLIVILQVHESSTVKVRDSYKIADFRKSATNTLTEIQRIKKRGSNPEKYGGVDSNHYCDGSHAVMAKYYAAQSTSSRPTKHYHRIYTI